MKAPIEFKFATKKQAKVKIYKLKEGTHATLKQARDAGGRFTKGWIVLVYKY